MRKIHTIYSIVILFLLSSCSTKEIPNSLSAYSESSQPPQISAKVNSRNQENDRWHIQRLSFQEPEGLQYDGLAFWLVSVSDNKVYLGNTVSFVQYADLLSGEIVAKILPQGVTGQFIRSTENGFIFSRSLYDVQMNLLKEVTGPKFEPCDIGVEGQWVNDVSDDLTCFLYSEQYALISADRRDYEDIANGLFLYDTTKESTRMIRPEKDFYYNIRFLPDLNYAFICYVDRDKVVHSAMINIANGHLQPLEESADLQHHVLNYCRKYIILTNGYLDKSALTYQLKPDTIPDKVPYVIDDSGSIFYYFDNTDATCKLMAFNANINSMGCLDLSSEYSQGRIIDIAENGSVIASLSYRKDQSSSGLYQIICDNI